MRGQWQPVSMTTESGTVGGAPDMRGGHQMCVDEEKGNMYLYGGWGGSADLGDLWQFNVGSGLWHCLAQDTTHQASIQVPILV